MPLYSADTIPFLPPPSFSRCRLPSSVLRHLPVRPSAITLSPVQWASALCFPPPSHVPVPSIRIMIICRKINIILL